jgi:hypothetical protein
MSEAIIAGRRSFSQLKTYSSCGEQYRLERIIQAPQTPAWWFVGGKAFHTATEYLDRDGLDAEAAWSKAWNNEFTAQLAETDIPQAEWRTGGRKTKDKPHGETGSWWLTAGAKMVSDYAMWRGNNFGWQIAGLPAADGGDQAAIEWEATVWFGTTPVKAFLDRLFVIPTGELCVVDLKTGTMEPPPDQLGLYAAVVELATGIRPSLGAYYMARKGTITVPENLDRFSIEYWTEQFHMLDLAVENGVFIAHTGPLCRSCGVRDYCRAVGGTKAWTVDLYKDEDK